MPRPQGRGRDDRVTLTVGLVHPILSVMMNRPVVLPALLLAGASSLLACNNTDDLQLRETSDVDAGHHTPAPNPPDPPCDLGPSGGDCYPLPDTCGWGSCQNVVGNAYVCMTEGTAKLGEPCSGACEKGSYCTNGVCVAWCDDLHPCAVGRCVQWPGPCAPRLLGQCIIDPPDSGVAPIEAPCDLRPSGGDCHPLPDTCASGSCQNVTDNAYACMTVGTGTAGAACTGACAKGHYCRGGICRAWCDDDHPCATGTCQPAPSPCSNRTLGLCE